jgi:hypothetical protein
VFSYRKLLGYSLLFISCVAWTALPVIPFLPFDAERLALWATAAFIFAEITWWLAVPLLGKELLEWCRYSWSKCKELFSNRKD